MRIRCNVSFNACDFTHGEKADLLDELVQGLYETDDDSEQRTQEYRSVRQKLEEIASMIRVWEEQDDSKEEAEEDSGD